MRTTHLMVACAAVLHAVTFAQHPEPLRGRVIDADTGAPIRAARVGPSPLNALSRTDEAGYFELAPGWRGSLTVTKSGYARATIPPTQVSSPLEVRLGRGAALTVHLVDESGAPAVGRQLHLRCGNSGQGANSDLMGHVRWAHLQPGPCELSFEQPVTPAGPAPRDPAELPAWLEMMRERSRQIADPARRAPTQAIQLNPGDDVTLAAVAPPAPPRVAPPDAGSAFNGPAGTGVVSGRVTDPFGRPATAAVVYLRGASGAASAATDSSGAYVFARLPAGRFTVSALYQPFGRRTYGENDAHPSGLELDLQDGQQLAGIDLSFAGRFITGYVYDEYGEPAEGARMVAIPAAALVPAPGGPGGPALRGPAAAPPAAFGGPMAAVNDLGMFRLFVPPGVYYVRASFTNDTTFYHPAGTMPAHAIPVDVRGERDAAGIDIYMQGALRAPVIGAVFSARGARAGGGTVTLSGRALDGSTVAPVSTSIRNDGGFAFAGIAPGEYVLSATVQPAPYVIVTRRDGQVVDTTPAPSVEYGRTTLTMGVDTPPLLSLQTVLPSTMTGRVTVEGGPDGLSPAGFRLRALDGYEAGSGLVGDDWRFELTGLAAPTRVVLVSRDPGWWLESLVVDGVNTAEQPIAAGGTPRRWQNVTARIARTGRLEGRALDGGSAVPSFTAVAFPVDHALRFEDSPWVRSAAPDQRGVFRLDLPPGDYWVVAIDRPAALTTALLDSLTSAAERVRVEQTPTVQRELRLVRLPR